MNAQPAPRTVDPVDFYLARAIEACRRERDRMAPYSDGGKEAQALAESLERLLKVRRREAKG